MSNVRPSELPSFVAILALGLAILLVDIFAPLGVAVGVLYVAVVVLAHRSEQRHLATTVAVGCSFLTVVGAAFSPSNRQSWIVTANVALSLLAIWSTTFLCWERRRSQAQLRRNADWFRATIESASTSMLAVDRAGRIVLANAQATAIFGYDRSELVGHLVEDLVPERFRAGHCSFRQDYFSAAKMRPMGSGRDLLGLRKDGTEFPVEIGLNTIETKDGVFAVCSILDVSDRKRTENELRLIHDELEKRVRERSAELVASRERLDLALKSAAVGTWDWNLAESRVVWDDYIHAVYGLNPGTFGGDYTSFERLLVPEDRERVSREVMRAIEGKAEFDTTFEVVWPDGSHHFVAVRGKVYRDVHGNPVRMTGVNWDVTERRKAVAALRESEERLNLALKSSGVGTWSWNVVENSIIWDDYIHPLFGLEPGTFPGRYEDFVPMVHPEDRDRVTREVKLAVEENAPYDTEYRVVWPDESVHWIGARGRIYRDHAGRPLRMTGVCWDVSDKKRVEAELIVARDLAQSANRAKSSFLANMSHEIRTPMNGIIGMTQLLSQTELRSHQREYLETVNESAQILMRLLNDILDFSKIEAGKLELERINFRLPDCIARAAQMLSLRAAEKGLEIACRVAPEIPHFLTGDPGRLQQVLVNLLGNAVKFTEAGEIYVNVDVESIENATIQLHVTVRDSGIGIAADQLEKIFLPFEQAESSTTRRFGGTGLGLTISRQLVELMHGRMWVESEPNKGSTFHFTVQLGIAEKQHEHMPAEFDALLDVLVLIVDDIATNRRVLSELLSYWHMHPIVAESADAARRALHQANESHHPVRLILLDHHMPVEDGIDFAESVKDWIHREHCPVIMISSGTAPTDSEHCQKLGIRRLMTKPVISSELLDEILHQFGSTSPGTPAPIPSTATCALVRPRRVLLAEDNAINRRVALGLLHARGHQVVFAENGQEAVELSAQREFDVILMDMQMPVMDGYEATKLIRQREQQTGGHIPIVAMTAEALKGDREHCLEVGMDDYVSKPVAPDAMYQAVERFPAVCLVTEPDVGSSGPSAVAQRESKMNAPNSDSPDSIPQNSDPSGGANPPDTPLAIDWSAAKERLPGGLSCVPEIADLLKEQAPELLAEIHRAIESRDANLLRRSAHTLKGSVVYFGADSVIQAALTLETMGREESFEGATGAAVALEREISRLLAAIAIGPPE
jgi:two-component system, sensor histidine kinase and response regulator